MNLMQRTFSPWQQAAIVFGVSSLLMLGGVLLDKTGLFAMDRLYPWTIATAFMLLFALLNSVSSLRSDNALLYWRNSIYGYLALAAANGLAAWLASGIPIGQAESYKAIYVVITFGFLVFLSMVNFMKKIVSFAEREEWNQPRKRR
jgi:tetrahydromethanopterin S-methyltransferase subunit C